MRFIKRSAATAALFLVLSCNQSNEKPSIADVAAEKTPPSAANDANSEQQVTAGVGAFSDAEKKSPQKTGDHTQQQQPGNIPAIKTDWDKKIIKTAAVNLEVKDYNSYYSSLREKIRSLGGYVAQEEQSQSDFKIENVMTIKVPVDQFDNAVSLFTSNVQKINERKVSSQDVTLEVVDTKSRMEAKKQVRQRYMDLMNQAKNMAEILSVQSSINDVQEEIESAAGRIDYLSHASVFSTINLTYYQILNAAANTPEDATKSSFGKKIGEAFAAGWGIISDLFVGLVTIWPLLLATFFAVVVYKRSRKAKDSKTERQPQA